MAETITQPPITATCQCGNPTPLITTGQILAGSFVHPANGEHYPRIQLVTVGDLLAGERLRIPLVALPYIPASALARDSGAEQMGLAL